MEHAKRLKALLEGEYPEIEVLDLEAIEEGLGKDQGVSGMWVATVLLGRLWKIQDLRLTYDNQTGAIHSKHPAWRTWGNERLWKRVELALLAEYREQLSINVERQELYRRIGKVK